MKLWTLVVLAWVPLAVASNVTEGTASVEVRKVEEEEEVEKAKEEPKQEDVALPEVLNPDTFDKFTSEHLTFVEFFSPFCSHCQALAPKWEQAFKESASEQERIGIHMRQVNCIESGDLCDRESVEFWPNLRLYVPQRDENGNVVAGKSKMANTFPRALKLTPENLKKFMRSSVAEYREGSIDTPSASEQLNVDSMMKIVGGDIAEPHFVSFFSSTNEEWERNTFSRSCMECNELKNDWGKLSNLILSSTRTGHLNCKSYPALCEKLGHSGLTSGLRQSPKYAMFLPKLTGIIRFDYTGEIDVQKMREWAQKLSLNSQYEVVTSTFLENAGVFTTERPDFPMTLDFPLDPRVSVVFLYEKHSVTDEDKAILPHLLEMVSELPHNIRLFASKSVKFEDAMQYQAKGLIDFVNQDSSLSPKIDFNKPMHYATTITSKPTILIFKEHLLFPAVYQNFAVEDMRNAEKIKKFINKNSFPLFTEFKPDLMKWYFDTKSKENDKVVVTFVDGNESKEMNNVMYNVSMVAHEYHLMKKDYYFRELLDERNKKWESVKKLKKTGADSAVVIEEMRKSIPHLFDNADARFVYVNLREWPNLAKKLGWDIDNRGYKSGDTIVVSKNNKYYWDSTLSGERLTVSPRDLRPVLLHLLDPLITKGTKVNGFSRKLAASPFGRWFRFLDFIHSRGFLGYLLLLLAIFIIHRGLHMATRRRKSTLANRRGIIGYGKHD